MSDGRKNLAEKLEQFKYPLVVLVIGVVLMLLPLGSGTTGSASEEEPMAQLLSHTDGVGVSQVLISENGVVVVCQGAENARVRLDIIRAVSSYTGFTSDKITILKMAD
ncbi:MAG: hypothetical protein ACI4O0_03085 [Candidatus Limivicinus sp.]